ncbi:MAG: CPBP family intramembrane metalloprotease [Clostridiales Family XIII bacterium]|nr:CPBP family intramembrane metalloprotease [Clostridiales Family XIII bacterium]
MNNINLQNFNWDLFRTDVRKDVRNVVLFVVFALGVNIFVTLIMSMLAMFSDPNTISGILSGETSLTAPMSDTALSLITMVGPVAGSFVFLLYRGRRFFTDITLPAPERMTAGTLLMLIVATQGIQFAYGGLVALLDKLLSPLGISLTEGYSASIDALLNPIGILYIVLVGPIFEELIFRGAVMGSLRKYGDNFAILFSALIFGIYHMIFMQVIFAAVLGLLLGYVACRYSLRYSILLHIVVNGLSVLLMESGENTVAEGLGGLAILICCIVTVILIIVFRRKLAARIHAGAPFYARTYANGFSSIAFWLYAIILVGAGIATMAGLSFLEDVMGA